MSTILDKIANTCVFLEISGTQAEAFILDKGELSPSTLKKLYDHGYIHYGSYKENKAFWKKLEISEHIFKNILRHRRSK